MHGNTGYYESAPIQRVSFDCMHKCMEILDIMRVRQYKEFHLIVGINAWKYWIL